ncbi:hypothetical protein [Vibrio injensis]|uniref:hypothetical protein n=1 Tax=Vibrio injensis TaxID=1307414 RepID=UPI000933C7D8|nr:hypothetical protein [Vibrio injensis]
MSNTPEIDVNIDVLAPAARRDEEQIDIEDVLSMEPVEEKANVRTVRTFKDSGDATAQALAISKLGGALTKEDISRVASVVGVDVSQSQAEMISYLRRQTETLGMTIAKIGVGLTALKESLEHGQFEDALENIGLNRFRASECMQIARFLAAQPDERLRRFAELPKSKVLELAKAEPEVLDEFLENEDGEELEALSVRDLRFSIKDLREQKARMAEQLLSKDIELETARNELKLAAGYERFEKSFNFMSPDVLEIREESYATTDVILGGLNGLRNLYERFLGPKATELFSQPPNPRGHLDDSGQAEARVNCAATLYHNLAGAIAPALRLMQELEESYSDSVGGSVLGHKYSEEELAVFQEKRDSLLAADEAARKARSAARHNKVNAGRRGRPKKVEG